MGYYADVTIANKGVHPQSVAKISCNKVEGIMWHDKKDVCVTKNKFKPETHALTFVSPEVFPKQKYRVY